MLEYRKGNLLDAPSGAIAHGVNCLGVMGSGVALAIKEKHPFVFECYKQKCHSTFPSSNLLGDVQNVLLNQDGKYFTVFNCFTQYGYGRGMRQVDYEALAKCFHKLNAAFRYNFGTLNIPKIGAGLGGGDWNVIESIIKSEYKRDVIVWEL